MAERERERGGGQGWGEWPRRDARGRERGRDGTGEARIKWAEGGGQAKAASERASLTPRKGGDGQGSWVPRLRLQVDERASTMDDQTHAAMVWCGVGWQIKVVFFFTP